MLEFCKFCGWLAVWGRRGEESHASKEQQVLYRQRTMIPATRTYHLNLQGEVQRIYFRFLEERGLTQNFIAVREEPKL
ncbi:hypothetical protein Y1Q_0011650 [Alligator mississippiensis]|uniref:Uncharacterized protein n=1 Tax=Alligator mississippiensis TaxID=8496 RepID=A0A151M0P0_ALLMI|nr:hypothetical protein Y1Q_0011650 [Alligator mississippiensis]